MIRIPEFILKDIQDPFIRENFRRLNDFMQKEALFKGNFTFFELTFTVAITNGKFMHGLGFKPLDVIQTSKTGAGNITFNYDRFNNNTLDITTSGACVVRCFIGTYKEDN